jgi:DNA mismatch repair protein MutH
VRNPAVAGPPPPQTEDELWARARALGGRTLGDVAVTLGVELPADLRRAKGLVGQLIERGLGAQGGSGAGPDLPALGVEIKTLPTNREGQPRESTFVCHLPLRTIADVDWEQSHVRAKLQRVLFVPVEHDRALPLASRRVGTPVLWSPSVEEAMLLQSDWEELAGRLGAHGPEAVTAHMGRALQVRPKGRTASEGRRAFYLRTWFTRSILERALR